MIRQSGKVVSRSGFVRAGTKRRIVALGGERVTFLKINVGPCRLPARILLNADPPTALSPAEHSRQRFKTYSCPMTSEHITKRLVPAHTATQTTDCPFKRRLIQFYLQVKEHKEIKNPICIKIDDFQILSEAPFRTSQLTFSLQRIILERVVSIHLILALQEHQRLRAH